MILSPTSPCTSTIARVYSSGNILFCSFREHNDAFRRVIKVLNLEWSENSRAWRRVCNPETTGSANDRAAELTGKLVSAGIVVDTDDAIAAAVQTGAWQPEHKRWMIAAGDKLGLRWRGQDDNLYQRSHLLPGSAWDREYKAVVVPLLYYAEVIGFADEHNFHISDQAQALLDRAARDYHRTILPTVPEPTPEKTPKKRRRYCEPSKFIDLPIHRVETTTSLLPHQVPAVDKLFPFRVGALFMDMGTGKTRCAIELAARRQQRVSRVIWFCPVSLKLTIEAEIQKHSAGEPVYVFDDKTGPNNIPPAFWYVVGIESMSSSDRVVLAVNQLIDADSFVIVDESSYIKGHASRRSMRISEIGKISRYRLLLTGTPISQGVEDLYAQMRFLSPDILGYSSFYSFANNHLEYSDKYPDLIVRAHGLDHLADKLAPYVYQVTKVECMSLPDKLYDRVYCKLTDAQIDAYNQAKSEILLDVEEPDSYVIFQLFTALQQIVSGFWNRQGEPLEFPHHRLETLQTVIGGILDGEKVIIWCKFVHSLRQITEALPGCALYYGDLSETARAAELERFRSDGCRFLIATQATGGHGLTLNEAHYHIFYENEFKYSHRIQAEDRSHRIGQTSPVTYIDIISKSGIDDRIQKALDKKEDVVKSFRREIKNAKTISI